jgi:ribosomal protein L11 methyltransferase
MAAPRLRRVSIRVPAAEAEIARARLLALAPAGFEEVDVSPDLELAVYADAATEDRLRDVFEHVSVEEVEPGWEDAWRAFHRPVRAGGVWIGPPWESPPADEIAVVVDPGSAFGTGAHPTTRACIELLARRSRGSLLDAGCGSGVLAVAAARLGFGPVFAVDHDPAAVEATTRTAAANGVDVRVARADALTDELPGVDLLVANIELRAVEALVPRRPAPMAIVSGYLVSDRPSAVAWEHVERLELDGWAADVLAVA